MNADVAQALQEISRGLRRLEKWYETQAATVTDQADVKTMAILRLLADSPQDIVNVRPNEIASTEFGSPEQVGRRLKMLFPEARRRTSGGSIFTLRKSEIWAVLEKFNGTAVSALPTDRATWIAARGQEMFESPDNRNTLEVCQRKAEDEWIAERTS